MEGDTWESWESPQGQTFLSVDTLTVLLSKSQSQKELYKPTKAPGTARTWLDEASFCLA